MSSGVVSPSPVQLDSGGSPLWIESASARGYSLSEELQIKSLVYADDLSIDSSSEEDNKKCWSRSKSSPAGPTSVRFGCY